MMPMRENLMPPAVEPEAPPTAMMNARVRKAPLLKAVVSWLVVTT